MTTVSVSTKISSAPMIWHCLGTSYQMELLAGFIGATQDKLTLAIRPTIGWAVRQGWLSLCDNQDCEPYRVICSSFSLGS
jgi:hypothetical protein